MTPTKIGARPRWILAIALALVGACQSATEPARDGPLAVTARAGMLVIQNTGSEPLYTFTITREASALVDWLPCADPTRCQGIAPGARREVPYSEIYGYTQATREVIVYAWHLAPSGNGFAPVRGRSVIVRL
jgi:hypothetical protein